MIYIHSCRLLSSKYEIRSEREKHAKEVVDDVEGGRRHDGSSIRCRGQKGDAASTSFGPRPHLSLPLLPRKQTHQLNSSPNSLTRPPWLTLEDKVRFLFLSESSLETVEAHLLSLHFHHLASLSPGLTGSFFPPSAISLSRLETHSKVLLSLQTRPNPLLLPRTPSPTLNRESMVSSSFLSWEGRKSKARGLLDSAVCEFGRE